MGVGAHGLRLRVERRQRLEEINQSIKETFAILVHSLQCKKTHLLNVRHLHICESICWATSGLHLAVAWRNAFCGWAFYLFSQYK